MLMLPQQVQVVKGNINKYDSISKSEYTFESTKDITSDSLIKEYTITDEDMNKFKSTNQYKVGNSDPFSPSESSQNTTTSAGSTGSNNTTTSSTNNSTGASTSNTTDAAVTQEKITNSNGGVANPPSTSK